MKWGTVGILLLAVLLSTGGTSWNADTRAGGPFDPTAPSFPQIMRETTSARSYVADAIPVWAPRFDDNRLAAKGDISFQLRTLGVASLAVNPGTVGTGSGATEKMTWDDIRDLKGIADQYGARLDIGHHSFANLNNDDSYVLTYDELVAELDPSPFVENLGEWARPVWYLQPGTPTAAAFARRNRATFAALLDSLGYSYGIVPQGASVDSTGYSRLYPADIAMDALTVSLGIGARPMWRPGQVTDPYWIPEGATIDLGTLVVERAGTEVQELGLPAVNAFNLASLTDCGTGDNVSCAIDGYSKTWAWYYSVALSQNLGMMIAMHDSINSDLVQPSAAGGDELAPGHFSPAHVIWSLWKLADLDVEVEAERKPHIRVGTVADWCEWMLSAGYAPGTDLIDNPDMLVPQWDIGDTSGVQFAWPRGLSSIGTWRTGSDANALTDYEDLFNSAGVAPFASLTAYNAAGKLADGVFALAGRGVDGYRGRDGGLQMLAVQPVRMNIGIGGLAPGRYRFSVSANGDANVTVQEFHQAFSMAQFDMVTSWENAGAMVYADTVLTYTYRDNNETMTIESDAGWHDLPVPMYFPASLDADLLAVLNGRELETQQVGLYRANWLAKPSWAFSMSMQISGDMVFSQPRLIYEGP